MDYLYKKSGTIFNAHSYWTKQPVEVVKKFIEKNSTEGDVILDPFCGSGMTGVAAISTNRRFVLSDISPICVHIAKGYCNKFINADIEKELQILEKKIFHLYATKCPYCNKITPIDYSILLDELEKKGLVECDKLVGHCCHCKQKFKKNPSYDDLLIHNTDEYKKHFYPTEFLFGNEPKRNFKRGIYQVFQLYSKRNLSALSILKENIEAIDNQDIKQLFLFAFTAILFNCSLFLFNFA